MDRERSKQKSTTVVLNNIAHVMEEYADDDEQQEQQERRRSVVWVYNGLELQEAMMEERGLLYSRIRYVANRRVEDVRNNRINGLSKGGCAIEPETMIMGSPGTIRQHRRRPSTDRRKAGRTSMTTTTTTANQNTTKIIITADRQHRSTSSSSAAAADANNGYASSSSSFTHTSEEERATNKNNNNQNGGGGEDDDSSTSSSLLSSSKDQQPCGEDDDEYDGDENMPLRSLLIGQEPTTTTTTLPPFLFSRAKSAATTAEPPTIIRTTNPNPQQQQQQEKKKKKSTGTVVIYKDDLEGYNSDDDGDSNDDDDDDFIPRGKAAMIPNNKPAVPPPPKRRKLSRPTATSVATTPMATTPPRRRRPPPPRDTAVQDRRKGSSSSSSRAKNDDDDDTDTNNDSAVDLPRHPKQQTSQQQQQQQRLARLGPIFRLERRREPIVPLWHDDDLGTTRGGVDDAAAVPAAAAAIVTVISAATTKAAQSTVGDDDDDGAKSVTAIGPSHGRGAGVAEAAPLAVGDDNDDAGAKSVAADGTSHQRSSSVVEATPLARNGDEVKSVTANGTSHQRSNSFTDRAAAYLSRHAVPTPICTMSSMANHDNDNQEVAAVSGGPPTPSLSSALPAYYTGRSSAYLQNLAEICHTILTDGRWQGLFRWEYEDDLRAVQALSRLYEPIVVPSSPVVDFACRCILCKDTPLVRKASARANAVASPGAYVDAARHETVEEKRSSQGNDHTDDPLTSESLYLYSRLFYRKGPWFRIDNIYNSIIAPSSSSQDNKSSDDAEVIGPEDEEKKNHCDLTCLDYHLDVTLPQLFQRISKLTQMGLIRGFDGEHECASVCDNGSLFRADELSMISAKLGGGVRPGKKGAKASLASFAERVASQRTLFANQSVPLIQQAGNVLLERLAVDIVAKCNITIDSNKSKPQTPTNGKESIERVRKCLLKLRRSFHVTVPFFVRLNEPSVHALRRVVRLYLCANSGPGEMRGTETNGWQSVNDGIYKTRRGELCPPCCQLWNKIRYPGLEFRFGLQSFCFMNSYVAVPVGDKSNGANGSRCLPDERIFLTRNDFRKWEQSAEIRANVDYLLCCYEQAKKAFKLGTAGRQVESFDLLDVSLVKGRGVLVSIFACGLPETNLSGNLIQSLCQTVNAEVDRLPDDLIQPANLLCVIGLLCLHVLKAAIGGERHSEPSPLRNRPWLRHLSWHACLAAVIWDILPIFEQARLYELAARATYFLFHGSLPLGSTVNNLIPELLKPCYPLPLAGLLLSRRTRGKIFDRLLIDIRHLHQAQTKACANETKSQAILVFRQQMQDFCVFHLNLGARLSTLGFSTLRELTRRLKAPFHNVLGNTHVVEAAMLGLRVQKEFSLSENTTAPSRATNEWEPVVDSSVANSLTDGTAAKGTRTSFVSYEDNDTEGNSVAQSQSMNVEEYAKELYKTGRLPVSGDENGCRGGWEGWADDEGRVLRTLFRIICGAPIFGSDFGCHRMAADPMRSSVFLTPYQQVPFDLHVSYQKLEDKYNAFTKLDSRRSSFYQRRYSLICSLRAKLASLDGQDLCDAVFDSVTSRLHYMHQVGRKDPILDRDLTQIRTLSAVAAGFGGVQLAAAFTALFFDYRTYAGGLPDLQLFRMIQRDEETASIKLIDASWIGEQFSPQYRDAANAKQLQALFFGDDDEYLGCSKDSSGRWSRSSSGKGSASPRKSAVPSPTNIPPRLELQCNGSKIKIECMSVEVKSANDVLSSRQVDWLNILDQNGYSARVCKFHASATAKLAAKSAAKRGREAHATHEP